MICTAPIEHSGTATGYRRYACRCARCTEAQRQDLRRQRGSVRDLGPRTPIEHGDPRCYRRGCRLPECRAAYSDWRRWRYRTRGY